MTSEIVVVILTIIGLGTVIYWTLRFCFWFLDKLSEGEQE